MELLRALAVLAEPPGPQHASLAALLALPAAPDAATHTGIFVFELYPYASVYLGPEGAIGGEAADRVAGFWRALGQAPPKEPDHLSALLGLFATLSDQETGEADAARRVLWRHGRRALFWEHLGVWIFAYLAKMQEIGPPFYRSWACLLEVTLVEVARELGPPDRLALHLREAPAMPDPRQEGFGAFLAGLLAMARSGLLLTRGDLVRCADALHLALRVGDRRFALQALLGQDAVGTLAWLAGEAERWMVRHGKLESLSADIAAFWQRRAQASCVLLKALGDDARAAREEAWASPDNLKESVDDAAQLFG